MFVISIESGSADNSRIIPNPTWTQVETELRSLNGRLNDSICLDSTGKSYMGIAGGAQDRYFVGGHLEGSGSFKCSSGKKNGPPLEVVVDGDYNIYPSRNVVDLETAIVAARFFFERGALAEQLEWDKGY